MSTKNQPSKYDCYTKAGGDEPIFTLRANDPLAPAAVEEWAAAYHAERSQMGAKAGDVPRVHRLTIEEQRKYDEAHRLAGDMRARYAANEVVKAWHDLPRRAREMYTDMMAAARCTC